MKTDFEHILLFFGQKWGKSRVQYGTLIVFFLAKKIQKMVFGQNRFCPKTIFLNFFLAKKTIKVPILNIF